jgi:hypothetical protein
MDLKNRVSHARLLGRRHRRRRDTADLAAQLTPPEELEAAKRAKNEHFQGAHQEVGAIVVENGNGGISKDLIEGSKEKRLLGLEPVVIVIVGLMLLWTLFIAWKITSMPHE